MMDSLWWKQSRESWRLLAAFSTWTCLAALYAILYELGHGYRAPIGSLSSSLMFYCLIAAIVLAIRLSQGERSERTLLFSLSLPISVTRVALVRLVGNVVVLCFPIVLAACVMSAALAMGIVGQAAPRSHAPYVEMAQRELGTLPVSLEQLGSVAVIAMLGGTELLLVLSLFGNWLKNQAQIGLAGAVLSLGSLVVASFPWFQKLSPLGHLVFGIFVPQSLVIQWGYGDATGGYTDHELATHRWLASSLSLLLLIVLGRLFVLSYGFLGGANWRIQGLRRRFRLPSLASRIAPPFRGRWTAMLWMEARHCVPIALLGLCMAVMLSIAAVATEGHGGRPMSTAILMDLPHSTFIVGILWSVVVGSAIYSGELSSGLGSFWRTRPIEVNAWFWTKFIVGLAAVLLVLDVTTILLSWHAPRESPTTGMSWAYVACFPILHALTYTMAVLGTCVFRRPVIGGLVAVAGFFTLTIALTSFPQTNNLEPLAVYNDLLQSERAGNGDLLQFSYLLVYGCITVMALVFSVLAYQSAKPYANRFTQTA